jgi:hypothetical protein
MLSPARFKRQFNTADFLCLFKPSERKPLVVLPLIKGCFAGSEGFLF